MSEIRNTGEATFPATAAELACLGEFDHPASPSIDDVQRKSLPTFFIVGPPRTGSSWLHEILSPHALLPSPSKETRFFDTHFHRGLKWYLAHYENSKNGRLIGEVAPTYFASTLARERMMRVVPDAKIVCVFRNPVTRLVSLYRLKLAYGLIRWNLEEAIERDPELLESSCYAGNLKQWRHSFGADNVLAAIYDDLSDDPQSFADSIADFIGLSRFQLKASQRRLVHHSEGMTYPRNYYGTRGAMMVAEWMKARRLDRFVIAFKSSPLCKLVLGGGDPFPQLPANIAKRLYEMFRPEVEELELLLNRDLSSWKFQSPK
jgi:hypothetical protein